MGATAVLNELLDPVSRLLTTESAKQLIELPRRPLSKRSSTNSPPNRPKERSVPRSAPTTRHMFRPERLSQSFNQRPANSCRSGLAVDGQCTPQLVRLVPRAAARGSPRRGGPIHRTGRHAEGADRLARNRHAPRRRRAVPDWRAAGVSRLLRVGAARFRIFSDSGSNLVFSTVSWMKPYDEDIEGLSHFADKSCCWNDAFKKTRRVALICRQP